MANPIPLLILFIGVLAAAKAQAGTCGTVILSANKIVNGEDTGGYKYPFFAFLRQNLPGDPPPPGCGGTLIDSTHVLTAAHCFGLVPNAEYKDKFTVALGSYDRCADEESTRQVFNVTRAVVHENFSVDDYETPQYNDIALITLDGSADAYTPACLPPAGRSDETEPAVAVGYGSTYQGEYPQPCHLMDVNLTKYSPEQCREMGLYDVNQGTVFCAGADMKGTCQGDSGGPLLTYNSDGYFQLSGLTSYGYGCAKHPAIYTNVGSFLDWIQERIDEE